MSDTSLEESTRQKDTAPDALPSNGPQILAGASESVNPTAGVVGCTADQRAAIQRLLVDGQGPERPINGASDSFDGYNF